MSDYYDFWDSYDVEAATTEVEYVRGKSRGRRIIWKPSLEEKQYAELTGTVPCGECHDAIELHDLNGCKVCGVCPQDWSPREIREIRSAHGLRWAR